MGGMVSGLIAGIVVWLLYTHYGCRRQNCYNESG